MEPITTELTAEAIVSTSETIGQFLSDLKQNMKNFKELIPQVKAFEHEVKYLEREYKKFNKKRKVPRTNSKPSGLEKHVHISEQLADFLNLSHDVEISRIEAVKKIYAYINEHDLKDKTNGRKILVAGEAGEKLKSILNQDLEKEAVDENKVKTGEVYNVLEKEGLQIFNMQSFIKHHFHSITPTTETPAVSVTTPVLPSTSTSTSTDTSTDTSTVVTPKPKTKRKSKK
jgi:chromatin remodeling complex protein RSC6